MTHAPRTPEPMPQDTPVPLGVVREVTIRKPVLAQGASTVDGQPLRSTLLQPPPLIYFMPRVYSNGAVTVQPMLPPMKAASIQADQDEAAEVRRGSAPKRRKVARVFTASKKLRQTPEVPRVDEIFYYMDGSMLINGVSHFPHQFFIFVDVNGMQHMIIIRSSCRAPGEYHESAPRWCHRVVFPNSPGFFSRIHDDIDSEIREGTGRFHRVASLAGFRPRDPWWLQGSAIIPDILDRPQPGESLSFPRIQKFVSEGDLVTLIGSYAMFRVMAVTAYNGVKSFFVVSIAPGNPVFPRAVMRVVLNEDIGGPLIQWRTKPEFWGDYMYDSGTENTLYYRRLESGPIRGSIVSVPGSVPRETARVVNYWIDPLGVQFFRVQFPIINPGDPIRPFMDFPALDVWGPHLRSEISRLKWPKITMDTPVGSRRPQLAPLVIPPPMMLDGQPEEVELAPLVIPPPMMLDGQPEDVELAPPLVQESDGGLVPPGVYVDQEPPVVVDAPVGGLQFFAGHEFLVQHLVP